MISLLIPKKHKSTACVITEKQTKNTVVMEN
jgi:hypothetical protein